MAGMNCDKVREELELSFGSFAVSDETAEHLKDCPACRAYSDELEQLMPSLGHDENIALSPVEIDRMVGAVESRIAPKQPKNITSLHWLRPAIGVAAAALMVTVAYGTYKLGQMQGDTATVEYAQTTVDTGYGSVNAFLQSELDAEMDDNMVSALIRDYSTNASLGASEAILDDISLEELEYLKKNLEVGDLL
jgi:hypothetical protein